MEQREKNFTAGLSSFILLHPPLSSSSILSMTPKLAPSSASQGGGESSPELKWEPGHHFQSVALGGVASQVTLGEIHFLETQELLRKASQSKNGQGRWLSSYVCLIQVIVHKAWAVAIVCLLRRCMHELLLMAATALPEW